MIFHDGFFRVDRVDRSLCGVEAVDCSEREALQEERSTSDSRNFQADVPRIHPGSLI